MDWLWIALICVAVLVVPWGARWLLAYRHQWKHAKHVIRVTEEEAVEWDFYGSMWLDDERDWRRSGVFDPGDPVYWPAPPADRVPWPELASDERIEAGDDWDDATLASLHDDSGPGLSSFPGPVQVSQDVLTAPRRIEPWPEDTGASEDQGSVLTGVLSLAPAPSRLADTGEIRTAHLIAEIEAECRAQDDDTRAYCSALEVDRQNYMHQFREAFA